MRKFNWKSCYKVGARWKLNEIKADSPYLFDFVIIGPDPHGRSNYKLCRLEYYDPNNRLQGLEQSYSHSHLKRYATPPGKINK